jgi:hypothetical protein
MHTNYLYIARSQSDPNMKKHNVFKVGHSSQPLERIQTLGGSGSTETYEPILIVALPRYVKDLHILAHRCIQKFVVHRHELLQKKYLGIFGNGHEDGVKRRREIVMFGPRYPVSKIKDLFRRVVDNISSSTGTYVCTDPDCIANGGASDCAVCTKFTMSLLNCIAYQKRRTNRYRRRRILESVETQLMAMITAKKKRRKWPGPAVGSFWIIHADMKLGIRVVRVVANHKQLRTSSVQEWTPRTGSGSLVRTLQSRFTNEDDDHDTLDWDQQGWRCRIHMKHFKSFCRILNVADVNASVRA